MRIPEAGAVPAWSPAQPATTPAKQTVIASPRQPSYSPAMLDTNAFPATSQPATIDDHIPPTVADLPRPWTINRPALRP